MIKRLLNNLGDLGNLVSVVLSSFASESDKDLLIAAQAQQLEMFRRQGIQPVIRPIDRLFWATLKNFWPNWRQALVAVHPDTVVRWHRKLFKEFWKRKSKPSTRKKGRPPIPKTTIDLIHRMATENPKWKAKKIAQELTKKLGIHHSPRTVRKYMPKRTGPAPWSTWRTFTTQQAKGICSCDFFTQHLANFEVLYVFVIMHLETRKILHVGVTSHPNMEFIKASIREVSGWQMHPQFLIHDNDAKFGQFHLPRREEEGSYRCALDQWLRETMNIAGIPIPYGAPKANAHVERLIKTLRVELLDHFIFWSADHLHRALKEYVLFYNSNRCHQGIKDIPDPDPEIAATRNSGGKVYSIPVLDGLINHFRREAA